MTKRTYSDEEISELCNTLAEVPAQLKQFKAGIDQRVLDCEQKLNRRSGLFGGAAMPSAPMTLGQALVESPEYAELKNQVKAPGQSAKIEVKTGVLITGSGVDVTPGGPLAPPERITTPDLLPWRKFVVADLVVNSTTNSGHVQVPRETSYLNSAAWRSEGVATVRSDAKFELVDTKVQSLGTHIKATAEVLSDAPQMMGVINNHLVKMLSYVEDDSLLNGTGSGNTLHGIYTQASSYVGTYDAAGTNYLDQIKHAAQELLDSNYRADGLVIHPADWNRLTLLKDSLGRYLIDDALGTPSQTLFGLKVAQSMAMTRGHFLVGEFQRAERWLRQGIEILVSYEAEDGDFLKGIVTIRATLREAFQVYRTDAFKVGAFLSGF